MSRFPFAVMLGAVWSFLASYPLAQHCSFHFFFIAQLVGSDQECASGVACSAAFRSPMKQPTSFANVSESAAEECVSWKKVEEADYKV